MSIDSFASSLASRRWLRWLAIAAGAFVALTVLAWLAAPPIARGQLESRLSQALGRKTTVESVDFNPLELRFTIRKLVIADPAGTVPLLALDELVANFSSASLWRWAPVLDALKLVHPSVSLARDRDGRYSVQDLIDIALAGPTGPSPRFSVNNIEIDDGSIAFDDGVTGRKHRVEKLGIGIPFLSSLPYQTDIEVTPRFEGAVNGAHFELGGNTIPFAERREAAIDIEFDALPLKDYVAYLPVKPRVELAGGAVTTHLKVVFVDGAPGERKLEVRGDARIDGLAVKRRDGSSLVAAERIAVALDRVDVFGRDARVASVAVDAPAIDVRRLADGTLELVQPLFDVASAAVARSPAREAPGHSRARGAVASDGGEDCARARHDRARRRNLVVPLDADRGCTQRDQSVDEDRRESACRAFVRFGGPDRHIQGRCRRRAARSCGDRHVRALEVLARAALSVLQARAGRRRAERLA